MFFTDSLYKDGHRVREDVKEVMMFFTDSLFKDGHRVRADVKSQG